MKNINYIKHLNFWFELLKDNPAVKPTHVSLYIALFQQWNLNHFTETFIINRPELMSLSKIGSETTYSKCLQEMVDWGWIVYTPSTSSYSNSVMKIIYTLDIIERHKKIKKAKSDTSSPKNGTVHQSTTCPESGTLEEVSTCPESGTSRGLVVGHIYKTINNKQKHININNSTISKYDEAL
ncbi:hypothetical protein MODO_0244 [Myroides odoratimimus]|uniref:Uncharacterized protein n=1 Tax=Myroides odoratimimus CCUG 10230 TaxID=883150 RepID=A0ABP2NE59_9FLAO|nr:hypothetical protein [Myroides odoratimimus]AJA68678.1 hypothetical protein MYRA21_1523 [Myroides sp. A21]EHO11167.1 hypothetical protein HMPREF9712_00824 [Myroides odoratimimus CCUG 10230]MDM1083836.1 hypothetical protein [Myroides odoratimimus]MDM1455485.1 hypothetical protein [Myroides odoratimimus]STZ47068.1 Uncharacterised protein [Myroides odoratimimus]